ncbi:hypothetical protein B0H17DRAFT_1138576 [Mycena rosella]|uniref:Uncharacterized protein n=1 Tax=Mycena rosella TaxID=1033263 RepID=A0AAD7D637_MYCRO|nr:hypothetical protein B0H17DRAFT_1138576 [Mycena rosella]
MGPRIREDSACAALMSPEPCLGPMYSQLFPRALTIFVGRQESALELGGRAVRVRCAGLARSSGSFPISARFLRVSSYVAGKMSRSRQRRPSWSFLGGRRRRKSLTPSWTIATVHDNIMMCSAQYTSTKRKKKAEEGKLGGESRMYSYAYTKQRFCDAGVKAEWRVATRRARF